jgi:hypothetical protein
MKEDGTYNLRSERISGPKELDGCNIVTHGMELIGA